VGTTRSSGSTPPEDARGLLAFFVLAFALSWGLWLAIPSFDLDGGAAQGLRVAGRFGPSVAAVVVATAHGGRDGLLRLLVPLTRWRAASRLWLVALLGPPAVVLAAITLAAAFGQSPGQFNDPRTAYLVIPAFITILVIGGPLGEELGWRGFALDRLQTRLGPAVASLLLGLVWGLWHLPLFLNPDDVQYALPLVTYLGQTTATAFVYTWLWNRTRSLPVVLALHTATNVAAGVFPLLVPEAPSHAPITIAVGLATAIAIGLTWGTRGRLGQRAATDAAEAPGRRHPGWQSDFTSIAQGEEKTWTTRSWSSTPRGRAGACPSWSGRSWWDRPASRASSPRWCP